MKKIMRTESDMGSIKIFNNTMACFFENGFGDAANKVEIYEKQSNIIEKGEFLGHFTVKTEAHLSLYDCSDTAIYTFNKGRWFVYLKQSLHFIIEKMDEDLHA